MTEKTWEFVKDRTAADGAVWRSEDGTRFKRTGGTEVLEEATFQRRIAELGYPVPHVLDQGVDADGQYYFTEESAGPASLHDAALAALDGRPGPLAEAAVSAAASVGGRLLAAQAAHPLPLPPAGLRQWFEQAAFLTNVLSENPDLDTPRVHAAIGTALTRLQDVPLVLAHLDYGLPNIFPTTVIDWQHHGPAPYGYDTVPALEIIAFKGGTKGYTANTAQRARYLTALDASAEAHPVSAHLGEFLLVKCFFFLALMRPTDPTRTDKLTKWRYRRALFTMGLDQYEHSATINTAAFPTLAEFTGRPGNAVTGHP